MAAPRLLDAVRERVRAKHYSYLTEKAYLHWIRRFIRFHGRRHPRELGKAELEAFLTSLATEFHVSASTQNQALAALLFLYREVLDLPFPWLDQVVRAKPRVRVPVVLTRGEVWALLGRLNGEAWLIVSLLYGSGMRLLECLQTRIKDIDLEYRAVTVRDGKGQKDRVVPLAEVLLTHIVAQMERARLLYQDDRNSGRSGVSLPHALARKYRDASTSWPWQFLVSCAGVVFRSLRLRPDPSPPAPATNPAGGEGGGTARRHREARVTAHAAALLRDAPARDGR